MIRVFLSYSHVDEYYRNELEKHLMCLKCQEIIESWDDRRILPICSTQLALDSTKMNFSTAC